MKYLINPTFWESIPNGFSHDYNNNLPYAILENEADLFASAFLMPKDEFIKIVESTTKELIELTNLKPNNIRIRDISYAWGSCSANKNITISLKLIKYSKKAIKYVILHELCHLKYMNHSKNFWNLVEKYMPDYKEIKKEFK